MFVSDKVKMNPLDLSHDFDFGHPGTVSTEAIYVAMSRAADTIAWGLAEAAAREGTTTLEAFQKYGEATRQAISIANDRLFSKIIADARIWTASLPSHSPEKSSAARQAITIFESSDEFERIAPYLIEQSLTAVSIPDSNPRSPKKAPEPAKASNKTLKKEKMRLLQALRIEYQPVLSKLSFWAWINGLIFMIGAVVSIGTFSAASESGGTYIIFGGAIVFGAINCIRNWLRYAEVKSAWERQRKLVNSQKQ